MPTNDWLSPRRCLREPIPEIYEAAKLLEEATIAHLQGDRSRAERLIRDADMSAVRAWTAPLLGSDKAFPERRDYLRLRPVENLPPIRPKADRVLVRMPSGSEKAKLIEIYGFNCAFCGIPVIRAEVRKAFKSQYPDAVEWGAHCHAAFWCMWLQYDHVVPHARGGDNGLENLVITCSGCNYGRMSYALQEVGLLDPRCRTVEKTNWDGLERFLRA